MKQDDWEHGLPSFLGAVFVKQFQHAPLFAFALVSLFVRMKQASCGTKPRISEKGGPSQTSFQVMEAAGGPEALPINGRGVCGVRD